MLNKFLIINNLFDNGLLNWLRHYNIHYLILNFDTNHVHIGRCHINLRNIYYLVLTHVGLVLVRKLLSHLKDPVCHGST